MGRDAANSVDCSCRHNSGHCRDLSEAGTDYSFKFKGVELELEGPKIMMDGIQRLHDNKAEGVKPLATALLSACPGDLVK